MFAVSVLVALTLPFQQASIKQGHYAVSNFHIEVDGKSGGYLSRAAGGDPGYEVITEVGPDGAVHKRPGRTKYSNIVLKMGASMGAPMRDWIEAACAKKYKRQDGSITTADFDQKKTSNRMSFYDALISEITMPALDGASKEPAYIKVSLDPMLTRISTKEPTKLEYPNLVGWDESNFEVVFPDFPDVVADRVSPINLSFQWDRAAETLKSSDVGNVLFSIRPGGTAALDAFLQEVLKGSSRRTSVIIRYFLPEETIELTLTGACIASMNPERDASFAGLAEGTLELMVEDFRYKVDHK